MKKKILWISVDALTGLVLNGSKVSIQSEVTRQSQVTNCGYDPATNRFWMHVYDDEFEEIPRGQYLPETVVTITKRLVESS